jgi:hypothetical protein
MAMTNTNTNMNIHMMMSGTPGFYERRGSNGRVEVANSVGS